MAILEGKNCIITGASRGLGKRIAETFWAAGANIMLVARSKHSLVDLASQLPKRFGQVAITQCADLGDPCVAETIVSKLYREFGSLDVLVNNAAIQGPIGPLWTNDWKEWQTTVQVNLLSPVALCKFCIPLMSKKGRGKIINLSGGGGAGPRANFTAYASAKAGLVRFSETLADETKDLSIDVNCVAPGAMNTAMITEIVASGVAAAGKREYEIAMHVQAAGDAPSERATSLCVFLASPASDGITGKLISAVWDSWEDLPVRRDELQTSDIYTLRRIVPKDRGKSWGDAP